MTTGTSPARIPPRKQGEPASAARVSYSAAYMAATLVACDLAMLTFAVGAGFALWRRINPAIPPLQPEMLLLPVCCLGVFGYSGLYPGVGLTAVELMRRIGRGVSTVYLLFLFAMFLTKGSWANSRGALLVAWTLSLTLVCAGRSLTTAMMSRRAWWGLPVLVLGAGHTGRAAVRRLRENRVLGYRPVAYLDDDPEKKGLCDGIPVAGPLEDATAVARDFGIGYAIVAIPKMPREQLEWHLRRWRRIFPRILILPGGAGITTQWTEPRDLGGMTGFETHQKLLDPMAQWTKRVVDLIAACAGLVLTAPLVGVCALWIRTASAGNPFYVQEREGRDGATLRILKLRTMYPHAEDMLAPHLSGSASAREEWEHFCKLKDDPRILPGVGHFLRKTSLDELPQLWNIVKGEMSLVGPRPFPAYHNLRFDPEFQRVRRQVRPGLTGLWQVTARGDGDLSVQEALDSHYIRNWSLWLDVYILLRTVRAVLAARGSH